MKAVLQSVVDALSREIGKLEDTDAALQKLLTNDTDLESSDWLIARGSLSSNSSNRGCTANLVTWLTPKRFENSVECSANRVPFSNCR